MQAGEAPCCRRVSGAFHPYSRCSRPVACRKSAPGKRSTRSESHESMQKSAVILRTSGEGGKRSLCREKQLVTVPVQVTFSLPFATSVGGPTSPRWGGGCKEEEKGETDSGTMRAGEHLMRSASRADRSQSCLSARLGALGLRNAVSAPKAGQHLVRFGPGVSSHALLYMPGPCPQSHRLHSDDTRRCDVVCSRRGTSDLSFLQGFRCLGHSMSPPLPTTLEGESPHLSLSSP